jgi:hypothetical protein
MQDGKKLDKIISDVEKCEASVKKFIEQVQDYDMERALKKVDAELMDALHNLNLAKEQMQPKKAE